MSLKLPLAPAAYDQGDQAQMRGGIERADQQNRKRREDLVLAPGQRLVFHDEHGAEQHFTGAILGGLVRSDIAVQGLSPAEQANARANIAAGGVTGTPGGSDGQIQFNSSGAFGGFTLGGDAAVDVSTGALTLATVNADTGTFGDGTHVGQVTVDAKGRVTGASNAAIAFPVVSFNGRTGSIALGSPDVTAALGYTPGTATSVGLSAPSIFTVSGSPVTTSGSLAFSLNAQSANAVLAGPGSGAAAAPTFRALVSADLPVGSASQLGAVKVDGTTITASGGVISVAAGGAGSGRLLNVQIITTTGSGTYTPTPGTTSVIVELQAGGGQGGCISSPGSGKEAATSAGSGGGYIRVRLTSNFSGAAYTVGAGGSTSVAGNIAGQNGGDTTFTTTGGSPTTYTAKGGLGGGGQPGLTAPSYSGAVPGQTTTGGDTALNGGPSLNGIGLSTTLQIGSKGGASYFDTGAMAVDVNAANITKPGNAAVNYGGGGGGAAGNGTGAAQAGGAGGNGLIIIWEYS